MTEDISLATSRVVLDTEWFSVHEETFSGLPEGGEKPYYRVHTGSGCAVLALTPEGGVVLIRQFRPTLRRHTLEIPAGGIDSGESPEEAARRELLEETGHAAPHFIPLGRGFLSVDRLDAQVYGFLAPNAHPLPGHVPCPGIAAAVLPWAEFMAHVREDRFHQISALGLITRAAWDHGLDIATGRLRAKA